MDNNTAKILEQLAQKLGTTTEYLWGILLKQAAVSATIDLISIVFTIIVGIALWLIHRRLMRNDSGDRYDTLYDKHEEGAIVPMVIATIIWFSMVIASLFSISNIVIGYFNPEYWALKEVMDALR